MQTEKKLTGYPSIDRPWLKYYSDEAISSPLPECTIYEYLWENNKEHLDNVALNYFDRKITFYELFKNIKKAAKAFSNIGVKKGDIVVMTTVTTPETIYAFYGLNRIGAIANMVDPRTSAEGIKEYITEVNAKIVLTIDVAYRKIKKAIRKTNVKSVILVSPADSLPQPKKFLFIASKWLKGEKQQLASNCIPWDLFIDKGESTQLKSVPYQKNTCCVIVHTGGTTGTPKCVMLSNDNLNAATYQCIISGIDFKRNHTWLNIMPPFIAYGIGNGLHLPLVIGMETILIPQFEPTKFASLLKKYRPNHMVGVPSHYENIIHNKLLKKADLSYIIAPTVGGDSMREELERETNDFLKAHKCTYKVTKGYGMTEVCAAVSLCNSNECNKIGSVGIPFTHTLISIFDLETGKEAIYGQRGEICIKSPNTMLGYYKNESSTDSVLRVHEDGNIWAHSGDIGYMDEDGFLFVEGRIKRMIIRHDGFKVFPSFIESVISKHKYVDSCCAVGVADKLHSHGMLPIVYVVLKATQNISNNEIKEELIDLCRNNLPEYAQPIDYLFRTSLPLTSIGKIDYRALEKEANCSKGE